MKVVVLGGSGMLGAMMLSCLTVELNHDVMTTVRSEMMRLVIQRLFPTVAVKRLDAARASADDLTKLLDGVHWVINSIGITKPNIHDDDASQVEQAIRINGLFPYTLARAAERTGSQVIQIATDGVYAGTRGGHVETDDHDRHDIYGATKSLGEVQSPQVHHLRCSIVGPELHGHSSLLDWFVQQPKGNTVTGFRNHLWNGITTLHLGRICGGIMASPESMPHLVHIVPTGVVSKAQLLGYLATAYGRDDVTIQLIEAGTTIDRTLKTIHPNLNDRLWRSAGYASAPTVQTMIEELAESYREWPAVERIAASPGQ